MIKRVRLVLDNQGLVRQRGGSEDYTTISLMLLLVLVFGFGFGFGFVYLIQRRGSVDYNTIIIQSASCCCFIQNIES